MLAGSPAAGDAGHHRPGHLKERALRDDVQQRAVCYLGKPFTSGQLTRAVEEALREA